MNGSAPGIRWLGLLLASSFVLLPWTHLKLLPAMGLTRPISSVIFLLVVCLLLARTSKPFCLPAVPSQRVLYPIAILLVFGLATLAIIPFYGSVFEGITRFIGYLVIFSCIYCAMLALRYLGLQRIAGLVYWGYLPVFLIGVVEALAMSGNANAFAAVNSFHDLLISREWYGRLCLSVSEPSFLTAHIVLLAWLYPYVKNIALRRFYLCAYLPLVVIFSRSGSVLVLVLLMIALHALLHRRQSIKLGAIAGVLLLVMGGMAFLANVLPVSSRVANITNDISFNIRLIHTLNIIYTVENHHWIGLGVGQYGTFWRDTFLKQHYDLSVADRVGELSGLLSDPNYHLRPWSFILGVLADFGVSGMLVLLFFLARLWRLTENRSDKVALLAACFVLFGAYPIVTPQLWVLFGLIAAKRTVLQSNIYIQRECLNERVGCPA